MKKILAFLLLIATVPSFAQITIGVGPSGNSNRLAPDVTYESVVTVLKYQQKTFWFPGGICYIVRTGMSPDMMTLATTMPEHLKASTADLCVSELDKINFENKFDTPVGFPVETLKEARTSNISCVIAGQIQTPLVYQIRFSNFALTGKDREIKDCLSKAMGSIEKATPFIPSKTTSL